MRLITLLLIVPGLVFAECRVVQNNHSNAVGTINQIRNIQSQVLEFRNKTRQCEVTFEGNIANGWHIGSGVYKWRNDMPDDVACGNAFELAKGNLIKTVGKMQISSETSLICDESNDPALKVLTPGQVLAYGQWRPHPKKPQVFWYQGTSCMWFVETNLAGNSMRQWEGIVCEANDNNWVVVDKF